MNIVICTFHVSCHKVQYRKKADAIGAFLSSRTMIFLFLFCAVSRILDQDASRYAFPPSVGGAVSGEEKDSRPNSEYAYVHSYVGDDLQMRKLLQAEILGYQLKKFNKSIDRVLLLPNNMTFPDKHKRILEHVFTHFVYRPFIQWPCKNPEYELWEKQLYFKLNIWSLNYSKVLYINGFNYILRDPSSMFRFHPPAAAPDYQTWMIARYGPTQNMDFLLIQPSIKIFQEIVKFGSCNYTSQPVNSSNLWETGHGPYDNGLIVKFFSGNISTLQWWWNYEIPGHYVFLLHQINRCFDPQVVSIRFPSAQLPWTDQMTNISLMWVQEADLLYEELGESIDHQKLGLVSTKRRNSNEEVNPLQDNDPNEEASRFYPEFRVISDRQFWIQCLLIVLSSAAFLAYSLTASNQRVPWPFE